MDRNNSSKSYLDYYRGVFGKLPEGVNPYWYLKYLEQHGNPKRRLMAEGRKPTKEERELIQKLEAEAIEYAKKVSA